MKKYLLDANVFIQSHRRYYPFDVCPGFWQALAEQHGKKRVFSIDRVRDELVQGKDQLQEWVKSVAPTTLFKKTRDVEVIRAYRKLVEWVDEQEQYTEAAKAEFADAADGWLVAFAKANQLVVVTQEEFNADAKARVLIPNLCRAFSVEYVNKFEMLRELGVRLVLGRSK